MDLIELERQGVSVARIAEIDAIEKELSRAFVQSAVEYAYARAISPVPGTVEKTAMAQVIEARALELAQVRMANPKIAAFILPTLEQARQMQMTAGIDARQVDTFRALGDAFAGQARERIEAQACREQRAALATAQGHGVPGAATGLERTVLERTDLAQADFRTREEKLDTAQAVRDVMELKRQARGRGVAVEREMQTQGQLAKYSPDQQTAVMRDRMRQDDQQRAADLVKRWNDLAAWEAYRRTLRAQTEINAGGDPQRWLQYALVEDTMVQGLKAPELASNGALNGATTKHYQPQVSVDGMRNVKEEAREELTAEPSLASRTLVGMPLAHDVHAVDRSPDRGLDHEFGHRFEPLHSPGTASDSA
ncbi:MAG: hypothetical protein ACOYN3_07760 [Acidimicrobiia bacterium]